MSPPASPIFVRLFLRISLLMLALAAASIFCVYAYVRIKRPAIHPRSEIFRGVYYSCVDLPEHIPGHGRVMIVEVHLLVPGVEVLLRPYEPHLANGAQYQLALADLDIRRHSLQVLINSVRYEQADWWQSLPGLPKPVHETVVVDGKPSHRHEHSYLLWCDEDGILTLEKTKPPSAYALEHAVWAVGMEGVGVSNGQVSQHLLGEHASTEIYPVTFAGIDPGRSILWLIAFEGVNETGMAQFASEIGVVDGGMLDSGDATNLVIGQGAQGVNSYTGIRGGRPLASWIGIRAQSISDSP